MRRRIRPSHAIARRPRRWLPPAALALGLLLALAGPLAAHYVRLAPALVERGSLTVGLALGGAPFSYRQDGVLRGFEVAIAEATAAAHGLDLKLRVLPRGKLLDALRDRQVDAVATLALPADGPPDNHGATTLPYLVAGDHMMVLRGNPFRVEGPGDLGGRTVSVTSGSSAERFAHDISRRLVADGEAPMDIHSMPDQRFTHFPVSMGHAAAYFVQTVSAVAASRDPESRSRLVPGVFQPTREIGFALLPDNEILIHAIEHALAATVATGKYRALLEAHDLPEELSAFK